MTEAYRDFISSTGFGAGPNMGTERQSDPLAKPSVTPDTTRVQQDTRFKSNYSDANAGPRQPSRIPNSVDGRQLAGALRPQQALQPHNYATPFPESNVLGRADARGTDQLSRQKSWQAVAVGTDQEDPALKQPASTFSERKNLMERVKEKMEATGYDATAKRNYMIAAVFFGVMTLGAGSKWGANRGDKSWAVAGVIMAGLTTVAIVLFVQEKNKEGTGEAEGMHGAGTGDRVVIMDDNLPHGLYPRQRDQRDVKPYPAMDDPEDNIQARMGYVGVDTNKLEGPRAGLGYRRSPATADKRVRAKAKDLMRNVGNYNMDDGTFDEYMARMDGEAPNQFYQAQPYMPFQADWDKARGEIDDSSRYFGIGDSPDQENRKWVYRDPRMQQGGAKTMHTKDPPPGSNQPVSKVHPWLERDESGQQPPVLLGHPSSREALVATHHDGGYEPPVASQMYADEKLTGSDTGQFIQDRMREGMALETSIPKPRQDTNEMSPFLQPEQTATPSKMAKIHGGRRDSQMLPGRPVIEPGMGPPDEPIDVKDDPFGEKPRHKMYVPHQGSQDPRDVPPTVKTNEGKLHETSETSPEASGVDSSGFMDAFKEKAQPTESDVKRAELDVRRE